MGGEQLTHQPVEQQLPPVEAADHVDQRFNDIVENYHAEAGTPAEQQPTTEHSEAISVDTTTEADTATNKNEEAESATTESNEPGQEAARDLTAQRITELSKAIDEIAGNGELSDTTRSFLRSGGSIDSALNEIQTLREAPETKREKTETDKLLDEAREEYAQALTRRGRGRRKAVEGKYTDALTARIKEVSSLNDPEGAKSYEEDKELKIEALADAELSVVADMLLVERDKLASAVHDKQKVGRLTKLMNNKVVRGALVAGVVGAAAATHLELLPGESKDIIENADTALTTLSSFLFAAGTQNKAYRKLNQVIENRQQRKFRKQLANDIVGDTLARRTAQRTEELSQRPDRPYTPEDAAKLVDKVYGAHGEDVRNIISPEGETSVQYANLVSTLVTEEVGRQRRELAASHTRTIIFRSVAVASSALFAGTVYQVNEAVTLGKDLRENLPEKQ